MQGMRSWHRACRYEVMAQSSCGSQHSTEHVEEVELLGMRVRAQGVRQKTVTEDTSVEEGRIVGHEGPSTRSQALGWVLHCMGGRQRAHGRA
jgi:hypothetical protein